MKEKDRTCPRKRFREDLVKQLVAWRKQGDRLIVCMDASEDIYKKSIGKDLVDNRELCMGEAVGDFTGKKVGQHSSEARSQLMESGPLPM